MSVLEEMFVEAQALQSRVSGPRSQPTSQALGDKVRTWAEDSFQFLTSWPGRQKDVQPSCGLWDFPLTPRAQDTAPSGVMGSACLGPWW